MARSDKSRPGIAEGYGSAIASDIARYGTRRRGGRVGGASAEPVASEAADLKPVANDPSDGGADGSVVTATVESALNAEAARSDDSKRLAVVLSEKAASPQANQDRSPSHRPFASTLSLERTDRLAKEESRALRKKVIVSVALLVLLVIPSLGIFGANSDVAAGQYVMWSPLAVLQVLFDHVYNLVGSVTHLWSPKPLEDYMAYGNPFYKPLYDIDGNTPIFIDGQFVGWDLYHGVEAKAGIIGITLICAVLLAVSGMLYQNVFKNPIAGPGMLGVSSGVSLGMMLMVYLYGAEAFSMQGLRYALCYGFGAAILVFVILAGRRLSGKGKPFDIVTMLLIGSILSQLVGFVVTYVTLFVMDPDVYQQYITLSQMLVVDTSNVSWTVLLIASVVSLAPVVYLRFRLNALAFEEQEVRMLGINFTVLRAVALICGAIMILAAQIHIGAVAMVSLIVPFLSRSWFGCEFRKQLVGNVCISTILLLICRDIVDLIPFVGDGIGIGSAVSMMALPVFLLIMARHMRGWE